MVIANADYSKHSIWQIATMAECLQFVYLAMQKWAATKPIDTTNSRLRLTWKYQAVECEKMNFYRYDYFMETAPMIVVFHCNISVKRKQFTEENNSNLLPWHSAALCVCVLLLCEQRLVLMLRRQSKSIAAEWWLARCLSFIYIQTHFPFLCAQSKTIKLFFSLKFVWRKKGTFEMFAVTLRHTDGTAHHRWRRDFYMTVTE